MERRGIELRIDQIAVKRQSVEKILAGLDLPEGNRVLNYAKFRLICAILFPPDELKDNERYVQEIFRLFDLDGDGVLMEREWDTFYNWLRRIVEPVHALLVVDIQNDFIDGTLALRSCGAGQDGADVIEPINRLAKDGHFHKIVYSLDWHPENHISFYGNLHLRNLHPDSKVTKEKAKTFDTVLFKEPNVAQILWPEHCVMNTWGSQLHKDLAVPPDSVQVRKGQNPEVEAYSVFHSDDSEGPGLQTILKEAGVTDLYVCGIAYDVCVKATCLDGLRLGYPVAVIDDCCRGVDQKNIETTKRLITENRGLITNSEDVLSMVNEGKRSLIMSYQSARVMLLTS